MINVEQLACRSTCSILKVANTSKKGSKEEGSESVEQEPQKQLKRGKCGWLDAERDIGSVGVKVSGLKQCLHVGKVFPFHTESEVSRQVRLDANRAGQ